MTMSSKEIPEVGPTQLDVVLSFLALLDRPGYAFGEWHTPKGQFPFYAMSDEVMGFVQALYDQGIVFSFDWPSWQEEAQRYVTDPTALAAADLLTLRKLLTVHVRKDRFVEGHLAGVLESGHIANILRRLEQIRREMG